MIRLETSFSGDTFRRLMQVEGTCADEMRDAFLADIPFALCYGVFLIAVYLWASRWRRYPDGPSADPDPNAVRESEWRTRVVLAAAVFAALFDIVEDVLLYLAAQQAIASGFARASDTLVRVGSIFAVAKFLLLIVFGWAAIAELIAGPRGRVLWRVRFSVLAVALGAVPLLAVDQGQDMLRRVMEGQWPFARAALAAAALSLAAFAVWRCARTLVEFRFDEVRWKSDSWGAHFAEHNPRLLAGTLLVLAAAAFAKEAGDLEYMAPIAIGGSLLVAVLHETGKGGKGGWPERIGNWVLGLIKPTWRHLDQFGRRVGETLIVIFLLTLFVALRMVGRFPWGDDGDPLQRVLDFAAWLCVVASSALSLWVYSRRGRRVLREQGIAAKLDQAALGNLQTQLLAEERKGYDHVEIERGAEGRLRAWVLAIMVVGLLFTLGFGRYPVPVGTALGPLTILAIFVAGTVFLGSVCVWIALRFGVPVVRLAIVAALLFSVWNDNHRVATLPGQLSSRATLEAHLESWIQARAAAGGDSTTKPIVLVAAAGGGLRAAYWTAIALAELQDADSTFSRDVFAISGVSGGSLGGALHVSLLKDAGAGNANLVACDRTEQEPARRRRSFAMCVRGFMERDFLSPLLIRLLGVDLVQRYWPKVNEGWDRSGALEQSWAAAYDTVIGRRTFAEGITKLGSSTPSVPVLLLNATHVESGRRFIASPYTFGATLHDAGDVLAAAKHDLSLSAAVHNSARFTFASPAGRIVRDDGSEAGRLVDGGYFENSGLVTLGEVYAAIRARYPQHGVMVLYLCNDPTSCRSRDVTSAPDSLVTAQSTAVNELLSPARALVHTRDARASLARTQLVRALDAMFVQLDVCANGVVMRPTSPSGVPASDSVRNDSDAKTKGQERVISPPLGWLLSSVARQWMDASVAPRLTEGEGLCRQDNVRNFRSVVARDSVLAAARARGRAAMRPGAEL